MTEAATVGSPEAIRAAAAVLRGYGERLRGSGSSATQVSGIGFEGPAAQRLKATAAAVAADLAAVAADLDALSSSMLADADAVAAMNARLLREAEAAEAEAEAEAGAEAAAEPDLGESGGLAQ